MQPSKSTMALHRSGASRQTIDSDIDGKPRGRNPHKRETGGK
jgi:hypothetical protein